MGEYADLDVESIIDGFEPKGSAPAGRIPGKPKKDRRNRGWNHRKQKKAKLPCDQCGRRFFTQAGVDQHKRDSHGAEK